MANPGGSVDQSSRNGGADCARVDETLGSALAPVLVRETGNKLSQLEWFRSTWQHGGASTAFGLWNGEDGASGPAIEPHGTNARRVFIKLPVGPEEYRWTTRLGAVAEGAWNDAAMLDLPTPRIVACGQALNGYDLAFVITERLAWPTLTENWCKESLEELIATAVDVHAAMTRVGIEDGVGCVPKRIDWQQELAKAREACRGQALPESQRWNEVLKKVAKCADRLATVWENRPVTGWCHGDLHPGNALRRMTPGSHPGTLAGGANGSPRGRCVLTDLALVHPGHWVEDAVYLERQFWTQPEKLFGISIVAAMAKRRRELGLETATAETQRAGLGTSGDYGQLANMRRVLMAATAPAHLSRNISARYLHVALETLERILPQVAH